MPGEVKRVGRPAGSPNKMTRPIKELAAKYGPDAIATLVRLMNDEGEPGAVRRAAAVDLLDRAFGKPKQAVDVSADVKVATKEQRDAAVAAALLADT